MDMDLTSAVVGGVLGIVASVGTLTAEKIWDRVGRLRIFYLIRNGGGSLEPTCHNQRALTPLQEIPHDPVKSPRAIAETQCRLNK